ncbi:polyprenol phosphomannose-dependent alpha 1,6 mannosyltransferase MptB [Saccharopolyspora sp. WRP15-2]|uniref:Polyprenol phosphomannose-dependent alpha 1,6 mannosyltransferase MptB n=1 Tax=Saccharopolyspora oryzae TaxID=2997343 RepID=A0ABT4V918_9PSEU|nr:polyprenol phosphomannose-dependent alpha 1,6 mannosyltransferase MptB [Saccharopolyspora oryzae]MDA3629911.1 polyprenol phosphomannose-dependent alpha 1,6 mannosyltransferase MptB [Saccharopolyspora oryzae]
MPPTVSTESAPDWPEQANNTTADQAAGERHESRPLPLRTIALGAIGSVLLLIGSFGAAGTLVHDPVLGTGPMSVLRYGHGHDVAVTVVYIGFALLVWAWVRLGRGVLAHLVTSRGVLWATVAWLVPMLIAPPLFTRDVYSYLGQGLLALNGLDPYGVGPAALTGPIPENVHPTWQTTPAPYGPLFMGVAKGVILLAGHDIIISVVVMRLVLLGGLVMLICALPGLVRHLGGRLPVALWLVAASPMTVVHLVGGPHNDMLMIGLLSVGTLLVLEGRHASGMALASAAMAIKATAGLALPFLVWIWASRLTGPRWQRFLRAVAPSLGIFVVVFGGCTLLAKVGFGWLGALSAPGMIVNYLSAPTAVGQAVHSLVSLFGEANIWPFVGATRTLGSLLLVAILAWNWWQARDGGPEAVRRAAIVLCFGAFLSPVLLPWYTTWGLALGAAFAWTPRALSYVVGASIALVLAYYPDGEQAMYNWPFVAVGIGAAVLGARSLVHYDPLGLSEAFGRLSRTPVHQRQA